MKYELTANRIREAMYENGISQQELADKSGIGKSSISHYANGSNEPGNKSAYALAKVLNVNPAWLMGLDVPKESIETLQGKMTKARLDFLMLDENDTEHILENKEEFENAKALYEKIQSSNEFLKLFENATPEAQRIVESFLKSQQQQL